MNVKQNLSILFFRKNQKLNRQGKTTIYVRVAIDGVKDEFSSGIRVCPDHWDSETKTVFSSTPKAKEINTCYTSGAPFLNFSSNSYQAEIEIGG